MYFCAILHTSWGFLRPVETLLAGVVEQPRSWRTPTGAEAPILYAALIGPGPRGHPPGLEIGTPLTYGL
jgi:hypothetical protein